MNWLKFDISKKNLEYCGDGLPKFQNDPRYELNQLKELNCNAGKFGYGSGFRQSPNGYILDWALVQLADDRPSSNALPKTERVARPNTELNGRPTTLTILEYRH
jgi:hypothetical protein